MKRSRGSLKLSRPAAVAYSGNSAPQFKSLSLSKAKPSDTQYLAGRHAKTKRRYPEKMGRSRRERVVTLTQTRKHLIGRESKQRVLEDVRSAVDSYESIYVFSTENMRNTALKKLRTDWSDSRFFFGRKKIAQVALGRTEAEEYLGGLRQVADCLQGNVGLLFTNREHKKVVKFFKQFKEGEFARSGFVATERVVREKGVVEGFGPSQVGNLRAVGMPVCLMKGKVCLEREFVVCEVGEVLTPERAKCLEFFGLRMAMFRVRLVCYYGKGGEHFEKL